MPSKQCKHPDLESVSLGMALSALADSCRVAIVRRLLGSDRELSCTEFGLPQGKATVSHHFRKLREGGLILTRVSGVHCLSRLRREEFNARFPGLLDLVATDHMEAVPPKQPQRGAAARVKRSRKAAPSP